MSHGKMSDFVSFLVFEFTLDIKPRILESESKLKYFYTLKNDVRLIMSCQTVTDLVLALLFE